MTRSVLAVLSSVLGVAYAIACSSSHGSAGACGQLQTCCQASGYPASGQDACSALVSANVSAECSAALSNDQGLGYCGNGSGSGAGLTVHCTALSACCSAPGLPSADLPDCQATVNENLDVPCETELAELGCSGTGTGTGTGSSTGGGTDAATGTGSGASGTYCAELGVCCLAAGFPSSLASNCAVTVGSAVETSCEALLIQFKADGDCGSGGGTGSGSGTTSPSDAGTESLSCTLSVDGDEVCMQMLNVSAEEASAATQECVKENGTSATTCPSTGLVGCCATTVGGSVATAECYYSASTAAQEQADCTGQWTTSVP